MMPTGVRMSQGERILETKIDAIQADISEIKNHLERLNGSVAAHVLQLAEADKRLTLLEKLRGGGTKTNADDGEAAKWKALGPIILAVAAILSTLANLLPELVRLLAR